MALDAQTTQRTNQRRLTHPSPQSKSESVTLSLARQGQLYQHEEDLVGVCVVCVLCLGILEEEKEEVTPPLLASIKENLVLYNNSTIRTHCPNNRDETNNAFFLFGRTDTAQPHPTTTGSLPQNHAHDDAAGIVGTGL